MRPSFVGLLTGMALGFALAFGGFNAFLIVAVISAIGVIAGKVIEGQIDLTPYLGGGDRTRR
jgi:ABC-type sulfate transport system permease component